ncbi:myosin-9-like isoform X2 [Heptranchias perlo]|uniref:myosin-9-like isoform X2 n=1 Tax=Heptranchias perlo TaxID=212740 RepID=UPI00355A34AE
MADFPTSRGSSRYLAEQDRRHKLGLSGNWCSQGLLRSPPLTLAELDRSYEELYRTKKSPLRFQDSLPKELESFASICPYHSLKGLRSRSVSPVREEHLRLANSTRRLYYDPFDTGSPPLPNGALDFGSYDQMMARRQHSLSRLPDPFQEEEEPLRSSPQRVGLGRFDVDLKVSLSDSGKKRAQLVDRLKDAHGLLEGQSDQLRKRESQLLESKATIELLSLKQKHLENSISQLEGEKNLLEMSRLEDHKKSGELQDKILHLEVEMAKAKSSLDLISRSHRSVPSSPSHVFSSAKMEDVVLKQAQHSVLVKTNEANQRLTDSLRAQTGLHDELNELRLKHSEASLERDLLSSKSVRLEEAVTNLKTKLAGAAANRDRFFQEKLDLHKRVQHLTLELERAVRGREGFNEQVADLHVELVSTKSQANRQDQEKVLLKEEVATIKQVNEKLTSELGEFRQKLELCLDQLHQLEAEKKIFNNQVEALETERVQLVSEKEMLLTAVQADDKSYEDELLTLKKNCKELRASEAELREHSEHLEAQLQQKTEELAVVTLEQHQVTQHWKEKWQETAVALRAKEKELQLAAVKCQSSKEKRADLLGDCESFAADLEELIELRAAVARMTAEKRQLKKQQEESGRIIRLLQLQKDIVGDPTPRGLNSHKFSRKLENLHAELQTNHDRINELEKEKGEMEMELKKFKLECPPLARVELEACKQELELEKNRSRRLQQQVHDLKGATQLLVEQNHPNQATASPEIRRRWIALSEGDLRDLDPDHDRDKNDEDSMSFDGDLSLPLKDKNEVPTIPLPDQRQKALSSNCPPVLLTQELLSQISSLQQDLKDTKTTQRQQCAIIRGLREELEEANLSKPGEMKAALEEVDSELFQVREELQKVWDMLHVRNTELESRHQELESARSQYTGCCSENQRLEQQVTSLKQQIAEKEQALRQLERLRKTEKTELEIKISKLELKLAEVEALGENQQQKSPSGEPKNPQSYPFQKCSRCDSFLEEMSTKVQDYGARSTELQEERDTALKSLNEVQVLTQGLEETVNLEQRFSQTLQGENSGFSRRSQLMSEQLATLVKEQEDLTKAYSKLPEDRKGKKSLEYWVSRSHLVQNVVEMMKSQEGRELSLEEENQRLKEGPAFQNFQKLEEEIESLQHNLDAKSEKMTAMACEMEALRHKNENLMKAKVRVQQQIEDVQSLREQSKDSLVDTSVSVAVPQLSDGQLSNPWATHSFQEFKPFNRRGRDPSPRQRENMTSPSATSMKDEQRFLDPTLPERGAIDSESAPHPEVWFSGMSTSRLEPKQASSPDRSSATLSQSRTPSPNRPNYPVPPLNVSRSSLDFSSASEAQSEDEKPQGRTMSSAIKCSLLLSPRPFNLHRSNMSKK